MIKKHNEMSVIISSLLDTYSSEGVVIWLKSYNQHLGGIPLDLINSGAIEQVLAEADRLAGGPRL